MRRADPASWIVSSVQVTEPARQDWPGAGVFCVASGREGGWCSRY